MHGCTLQASPVLHNAARHVQGSCRHVQGASNLETPCRGPQGLVVGPRVWQTGKPRHERMRRGHHHGRGPGHAAHAAFPRSYLEVRCGCRCAVVEHHKPRVLRRNKLGVRWVSGERKKERKNTPVGVD